MIHSTPTRDSNSRGRDATQLTFSPTPRPAISRSPSPSRGALRLTDLVSNGSFEDGQRHDRGFHFLADTDHYVYCSGRGYLSPCYMRIGNRDEAVASVAQDVSYQALSGMRLGAIARLRCPGKNEKCLASVTYWGIGDGLESRSAENLEIPSDGRWYECRLDVEHGAARGFEHEHSTVRIEVYNHRRGSTLLDVDAITFGPYASAPPAPSGTPSCLAVV
jgi:hypothetical protein